MSELLPILEAVDRLNSWVRSTSFSGGMCAIGLRRRIYEIKGQAIEAARGEFVCSHRPLTTIATCRDCGGSGRYTDWGGHEWPHCRACESSGNVRLRFVETTILTTDWRIGSFRWHSPRERWTLPSSLLGVEIEPGDWHVNLPGRDLTLNEAARDLLACDARFPGRSYRKLQCYDGCDCPRHYTLYLGRANKACPHCGVALDESNRSPVSCGKRDGRAEYSFVPCAACYARLGKTMEIFNVGMPPELLEPEYVRAWVEKNGNVTSKEEGQAA